MQDRRKYRPGGFTLIELLVVVSIIAILVAVFSVGARKIRVISFGLQQKSAFHAMTVGLELFSSDFDGYPDSHLRQAGGYSVTGAQHLAEALLGRDQRGFEPRTGWFPLADIMFNATAPADLYRDTDASLARRKSPYCEIKYGQIAEVRQLWESRAPSSIYAPELTVSTWQRSPVITDVFRQNNAFMGERVGMPILYFKADSTKRFRVDATRQTVDNPDADEYRQWAYNFEDNLPVLQLPWLRELNQPGLSVHYQDPDGLGRNQAQMFYEQITQTADSDRGFFRPYNEASFLLISAGWDGIFGTKDDIVNFD